MRIRGREGFAGQLGCRVRRNRLQAGFFLREGSAARGSIHGTRRAKNKLRDLELASELKEIKRTGDINALVKTGLLDVRPNTCTLRQPHSLPTLPFLQTLPHPL